MLNPQHIKSVIGAFCLLLAISAPAGDLYKWQDEQGVWHFSSKPPDTDEQYDTLDMPANPTPLVTMRKLGSEYEPEYSFVNNIWGPIELELKLHDAENVTPEPPLPARPGAAWVSPSSACCKSRRQIGQRASAFDCPTSR